MDFEHFANDLEEKRLQCERFLEQQVGKLALQESRAQIRDAKDMQRIAYLAFVFVPLSLVSSFFGMNVKELNSGSTSLWVFFVAAIVLLLGSLLVIWLAEAIPMRFFTLPIVNRLTAQSTDPLRYQADLPPALCEEPVY